MYFASDNGAGASSKIIAAVVDAMSGGPVPSYGNDEATQRAERIICEVFEREVAVFFCTSGTATNAMGLAHVTPPWGAVYGHEMAHALATECGAPEFYSGAKFVPLPGPGAKLTPDVLDAKIAHVRIGDPHHVQPATVTVTNLTECGTLYRPAEVAAIGAVAQARGLKMHMDGARFANAIASAGCTPAEMTWKAGVDVLSLGATKNGAIAAEAVVFFHPADAKDFLYRRMRGGHLLSKMRFVSAQFEAWFGGGHWLELARHANAMAQRLAQGLAPLGIRLAWPVEGNEVFAIVSPAQAAAARAAGVNFHPWPAGSLPAGSALEPGEQIARWISSFATTPTDVDGLLAVLRGH
jgi:threonine aldolase